MQTHKIPLHEYLMRKIDLSTFLESCKLRKVNLGLARKKKVTRMEIHEKTGRACKQRGRLREKHSTGSSWLATYWKKQEMITCIPHEYNKLYVRERWTYVLRHRWRTAARVVIDIVVVWRQRCRGSNTTGQGSPEDHCAATRVKASVVPPHQGSCILKMVSEYSLMHVKTEGNFLQNNTCVYRERTSFTER